MREHGQDAVADGTRTRWVAPVRRALARMLNPDGLSAGYAPAPQGRQTDRIVDCAAYLDGRRLPGPADHDAALVATRRGRGFVWLGLHDPQEADFAPVARTFGLDDLVAGHALNREHRPAVERYDKVTVIVLRTSRYVEHSELTETSEVVETGSVTAFVGPRFVITVRHGAPGALRPVRADLEARPTLLALGPWAVAYAVCERIVGSYVEVAGAVEADIDAVEEQVFAPRTARDRIAHIYQLKRELMEFRRAVAPLQRPFGALLDDRELPRPVTRYFRDLHGVLSRTVERVTGYDDLLNSILQARLAQVSVDQNNDMRKIAAWAAIFAVQTFIAGIYGMNFEFIPGSKAAQGFWVVLVVMLVLAAAMHRGFRRNNWL
ncbi:magnesium and cobalt transport protein CorA [Micromonospora sp. WMMD1102]|uniref:magnesium and cobalt transport protein CorA n=1 Tax=Micromonospora sp. WMMD1102 TaxID=3016105 RepID=UPI0024154147|nr:magnesium and cobalt transport protein CorA [Micromonospora sp. WMMD1102]MDG4786187.1 magnesium and cobalt transport protein CorA [Micromonospora sp. WMMD1102]